MGTAQRAGFRGEHQGARRPLRRLFGLPGEQDDGLVMERREQIQRQRKCSKIGDCKSNAPKSIAFPHIQIITI